MDEWVVRAANSTTYTPFGSFYDGQCIETVANPWKFTGQWHDEEIDQYHLRARQYDPAMMRFTARDPVVGKRQEPLTLHKYLYCLNNPSNMVDIGGRSAWNIAGALIAGTAVRAAATYTVAVGIDRGDDTLFEAGLQMHHLIAPAMYVGALLGPSAPGLLLKGGLALWNTAKDATGVTYLAGNALANAMSTWALTHFTFYEIASMVDVAAQYCGPQGGIPFTPAGFAAWLHVHYYDEY